MPTGPDIKCVLKSQLIRLLAYSLPFIRDDDIIVTADVDAFVMTSDIYKPLLLPGRQIWLYRYAFTLGTGATFMMPFIGIKVIYSLHEGNNLVPNCMVSRICHFFRVKTFKDSRGAAFEYD